MTNYPKTDAAIKRIGNKISSRRYVHPKPIKVGHTLPWGVILAYALWGALSFTAGYWLR